MTPTEYAGLDRRDPTARTDLYTTVGLMQAKLDANTAMTQQVAEQLAEMKATQDASRADDAELLDIFRAIRGTLKAIGWLGNFVKWIAGLGAAGIGLYFALKGIDTGLPPPGGPHP